MHWRTIFCFKHPTVPIFFSCVSGGEVRGFKTPLEMSSIDVFFFFFILFFMLTDKNYILWECEFHIYLSPPSVEIFSGYVTEIKNYTLSSHNRDLVHYDFSFFKMLYHRNKCLKQIKPNMHLRTKYRKICGKKKKRETDFQIRIHSKYFTMRLQMLLRFGTQYDLIVQNVSVL